MVIKFLIQDLKLDLESLTNLKHLFMIVIGKITEDKEIHDLFKNCDNEIKQNQTFLYFELCSQNTEHFEEALNSKL